MFVITLGGGCGAILILPTHLKWIFFFKFPLIDTCILFFCQFHFRLISSSCDFFSIVMALHCETIFVDISWLSVLFLIRITRMYELELNELEVMRNIKWCVCNLHLITCLKCHMGFMFPFPPYLISVVTLSVQFTFDFELIIWLLI